MKVFICVLFYIFASPLNFVGSSSQQKSRMGSSSEPSGSRESVDRQLYSPVGDKLDYFVTPDGFVMSRGPMPKRSRRPTFLYDDRRNLVYFNWDKNRAITIPTQEFQDDALCMYDKLDPTNGDKIKNDQGIVAVVRGRKIFQHPPEDGDEKKFYELQDNDLVFYRNDVPKSKYWKGSYIHPQIDTSNENSAPLRISGSSSRPRMRIGSSSQRTSTKETFERQLYGPTGTKLDYFVTPNGFVISRCPLLARAMRPTFLYDDKRNLVYFNWDTKRTITIPNQDHLDDALNVFDKLDPSDGDIIKNDHGIVAVVRGGQIRQYAPANNGEEECYELQDNDLVLHPNEKPKSKYWKRFYIHPQIVTCTTYYIGSNAV